MSKKTFFLVILVIVLIVATVLIFSNKKEETKITTEEIPQNYIAVFNGGSGEMTRSTYIYKINNGHGNIGYEYINTENTTKSWGSPDWNVRILKKGEAFFTDEVFKIAEENGAYSYVKLPNDKKAYSIEEFKNMFIKN